MERCESHCFAWTGSSLSAQAWAKPCGCSTALHRLSCPTCWVQITHCTAFPHPSPPPHPLCRLQMNAGIILSFFNQRYFADPLSTVCEFIPQVRAGQGGEGWWCVGAWRRGARSTSRPAVEHSHRFPGSSVSTRCNPSF